MIGKLKIVKGGILTAFDLRIKFFDALSPVCDLLQEAESSGFEIGFSFGKNAFGKTIIQAINLMKKY